MPLIAPALGAGWLLAFTLSLDDLVVASFVSGPGASTLPMVVYSSVRLGVSPQINALATLMILAVALTVGTAGWLLGRKARGRKAGDGACEAAPRDAHSPAKNHGNAARCHGISLGGGAIVAHAPRSGEPILRSSAP
jgi:hypothetical protein